MAIYSHSPTLQGEGEQEIVVMANPKNIAEEYFSYIPKREYDKARELMHPEYSYTGADGQRQEGADAGLEVIQIYTNAFPDLHLDIKHMHAAGDIVVIEFTASGTHKGELMGIAPTGKKMKVPVCNVLEVRDDKVYAEREYLDSAVMFQQLGVEAHKQKATA